MPEKDNDPKPRDQYVVGTAIVQLLFHGGVDKPRDAHQLGDFDVSMIPDWAFWPFENGGFISEVSHGQWGALIERLEGIGKNLLLDKAGEALGEALGNAGEALGNAGEALGNSWKSFKAWAIGEPHNCSFRGVGFDFQARGEFTYAQVGTGDSELRIDVRHRSIGNHAAVIEAVAVKLGPLVIEANVNRLNPTIGGRPAELGVGGVAGFKTTDGKFLGMMFGQHNCFQIVDQSMHVVQIDRVGDHFDLYVMLNAVRAAEAKGVLGNPLRGLLHIDGTPLPPTVSTDEFRRFASDWAVREDQTLFTDGAFAAYDPKFPERFLTVAELDRQTRTRAEALSRTRLGDSADKFLLESFIYDVGFAGESYQKSYGFHGLPKVASRLSITR